MDEENERTFLRVRVCPVLSGRDSQGRFCCRYLQGIFAVNQVVYLPENL